MLPLLTIGIPTFNRAHFLAKMLTSLIEQIDKSITDLIEIIVSDNASTDNTADIVSYFSNRMPGLYISYYRHEKNLGIDANIYKVMKLARGKYVFILSDDDILIPGALSRILNQIIDSPIIDAICPNIRAFARENNDNTPPWLILDEDRIINTKDEGLNVLGTMLTYLSCLLFRKELVDKINYSERVGTLLLCSYLFVDIIKASKQMLIYKEPCLLVRPNQSINYDIIQIFVSEYARVLNYARKNGFSKRTIRLVMSNHAKWLINAINQFKNTSYRPNLKKRFIDSFRVLAGWWLEPLALLRIEKAIWSRF